MCNDARRVREAMMPTDSTHVGRLTASFDRSERLRFDHTMQVAFGIHHQRSGYARLFAEASWNYTQPGEDARSTRMDAIHALVDEVVAHSSGPQITIAPRICIAATTNLHKVVVNWSTSRQRRYVSVLPKDGVPIADWHRRVVQIFVNPLQQESQVYFRIFDSNGNPISKSEMYRLPSF